MASEEDLTLYQNDDPQVKLVIRKNAEGEPYSLLGQRVELAVKVKSTVTTELFRLSSVDGGITVLSDIGGTAVADFSDLLGSDGKFWYHSWVADADDPDLNRRTWAFGQLTVKAV